MSLEWQVLEEFQKEKGLKAQHEVSLASRLSSFCFAKGEHFRICWWSSQHKKGELKNTKQNKKQDSKRESKVIRDKAVRIGKILRAHHVCAPSMCRGGWYGGGEGGVQGIILASRVPVGFIINEIRDETCVQFKSVFTAYGMNWSTVSFGDADKVKSKNLGKCWTGANISIW